MQVQPTQPFTSSVKKKHVEANSQVNLLDFVLINGTGVAGGGGGGEGDRIEKDIERDK